MVKTALFTEFLRPITLFRKFLGPSMLFKSYTLKTDRGKKYCHRHLPVSLIFECPTPGFYRRRGAVVPIPYFSQPNFLKLQIISEGGGGGGGLVLEASNSPTIIFLSNFFILRKLNINLLRKRSACVQM